MPSSFKNAIQSWIVQIEPSPTLLQGSRVELHPFAHAQFASLKCVQRLSPKKGASDKNSHTGTIGFKVSKNSRRIQALSGLKGFNLK